jgi:NADPH-dependent 2,4-dienoyl-CoA reductase/sulfur reductase-like enzyme
MARQQGGDMTQGSKAKRLSRRKFLAITAASAAAGLPMPAISQGSGPRLVVIGGGFGGANCARTLKKLNPQASVTLIEANATYSACPLANAVLADIRPLSAQQFDYARVAADGVTVVIQAAVAVDSIARNVTVSDRSQYPYDRLVIAPGIDFRFDALPGYTPASVETMPHAWTDGSQTLALRRQLLAMDDGGTVVISAPPNPARCPPGPYERASMIASYLKARKPRSKIIILDSKDTFTMQRQFQNAWNDLYPNMIEWIGVGQGGNVTEIDTAQKTFITDFDKFKADVGNVIPPQKAGEIAHIAGVVDRTSWCPVNPVSFESALKPGIHVIGDAAMAGTMPKSAFAANEEGKICAAGITKALKGEKPDESKLTSVCYSLIAPDYAISISGVYRPNNGQFLEVDGTGVTSPVEAPRTLRTQEARFADVWFKTITQEIFG